MTRRVLFFIGCSLCIIFPVAAEESLKLPYTAGVSMLVSRGYETPATHVNKDAYALDFVQGECKSFGTPVRAIQSGVVSFVNTRDSWGGGYGKNIILDHGEGQVSRYAHLSEYAADLKKDNKIMPGEVIGYQGNSGNVIGLACKEHPGTHLHMSMLRDNMPVRPEPMSEYSTFVAGNWYVSDNYFFLPTSTKQAVTSGDFSTSTIFLIISEHVTEAVIHVTVKNIGTTDWPLSSVSLNVVGGIYANMPFYHKTWATSLRPVIIQKKIAVQSRAEMEFIVSVPEYITDHTLRFQLVSSDSKTFSRIDKNFLTVHVQRERVSASTLFDENRTTSTPHSGSIAQGLSSAPGNPLYIPEIISTAASRATSFVEIAAATVLHVMNTAQEVIQTITENFSTTASGAGEPSVSVTGTESITVAITTTTIADFFIASTTINTAVIVLPTSTTTIIQENNEMLFAGSTQELTTSSVSINVPVDKTAEEKITVLCGQKGNKKEKQIIISPTSRLDTLLAKGDRQIVLKKEGSPYVFGIDTMINKNQILNIEEGTIIIAENEKSSLLVKGTMVAQGSVAFPIRFTSACEIGENNAGAGDWSGIKIFDGGIADMTYVNMVYAGAPFIISSGALASSDAVSRVVNNYGGTLKMKHMQIEKSYLSTNNEQLNALVWVEHSDHHQAVFLSEYSLYSDGYRAIRLEGKNSDQYLQGTMTNNTFYGFSALTGPLSIYRDMPKLEKNKFVGNTFNGIYLQGVYIRDQYQLEPDALYLVSGLTVDKLAALTIPEGITLRMMPGSDMMVDGELIIVGTGASPVTFMPDSTLWGALIFSGAKGTISHLNISGGGLSQSIPSGQSRMIHAANSGVTFDSVHIHDSRVPGALVGADTSVIRVSDSLLSWKQLPPVSSWITYGIYMDKGELLMKSVDVQNVVVPVYASPGTVVEEDQYDDAEIITEAV